MKKLFTLFFLASVVVANAQYIPNGAFEEWKGEGNAGSSYQASDGSIGGGSSALGMRQRPGDEPRYWEGSSVNQKVMLEKKESLVFKSTGRSGNAVKLENKYVGAFGVGSNAPGFISFATPWVYAISNVSSCDGGVYGGMQFTYRPDAIEGWYKRSGGTGESAHIIVYLWNGTFKSTIRSSMENDVKDDVDRAVMGKSVNVLERGTLIASCDYAFSTTNNNDWQKITVPLDYVSGTDGVNPEKINVIISSGDYWTRSNIKAGSVLEVDDVRLVYYSELASLVFDGKNYFVKGKEAYSIGGEYDESKLSVASNGKGATIEKSYDADNKLLTISIKGNDYAVNSDNVHTYTVRFGEEEVIEPEPEPTPGDVDYTPTFTGKKSRLDRLITRVMLSSGAYPDEESNMIEVDNTEGLCFNDYSSVVTMRALAGETVDMTVNIGIASWMNAYVYIDADRDGFDAAIADGSEYVPAGDLLAYSFYNNGGDDDTSGWNSVGDVITGDDRSTVYLPSFIVPSKPGVYRMRVKLDWCNIDPAGDTDGKFGDFMDNGGQIVDFMLEVVGREVDYTPANTGVRDFPERNIFALKLFSETHGESVYELTSSEQVEEYLDLTDEEFFFVAAPGEQVSVELVTEGSWINRYLYIDFDADGFDASIAEDSNYQPSGDLVSYSFYNNGSDSDVSGWNSDGTVISQDERAYTVLPVFAAPAEAGTYRMRIKQDWCSIDPMGDSDSNFNGTFSDYGGQIIDVDFVVSAETEITEVCTENSKMIGIYDLQGRKIEQMTSPGLYIVNGKKVLVK